MLIVNQIGIMAVAAGSHSGNKLSYYLSGKNGKMFYLNMVRT